MAKYLIANHVREGRWDYYDLLKDGQPVLTKKLGVDITVYLNTNIRNGNIRAGDTYQEPGKRAFTYEEMVSFSQRDPGLINPRVAIIHCFY